jgi:hypothetical protein
MLSGSCALSTDHCPVSIKVAANIGSELLGFWTLSIVQILIVTRKKKNKHDVSETGSVFVLR